MASNRLMNFVWALMVLVGMGSAACAAQQPNVLFIAIDDLRTELGCYGLDYVDSPNLDRLASQGVLFTNHFVQVPTCGASRFALLTGRSPANSDALGNGAMYSGKSALDHTQLAGAQSMPELFRRSGYHTVNIGKISHTADGRVYAYDGSGDGRDEIPHAWDELPTPFGSWKRGWGIFFAYANGRSREDHPDAKDLMEFVVENDDDLPDGLMATHAIQKLAELKDNPKPFFLGLGFFKPHLPFVAPKQDWDAIAKRDVPPPPMPEKIDSAHWHKSGEFYKYNTPYEKTNPLTTANAITARRAYLACVRYADRQVGRVLDALDDLGLAENTIVVVWGDHGWHLGDSAIWAKHAPFDRALRSTLMVRAPGVTKAGLVSDALVESIDLYPTLIDLAKPSFTKTQFPLDGKSLRPLLTGSKKEIHPAVLSYWKGTETVRTKTHRLISKPNKSGEVEIELYDHTTSPDPVKNIANSHPKLVKELQGYLPGAE